ncbi:MAG: methyltransferase domain-containing protein [Elusimicrobia bacterium]|nr:methyltransferase domain-containing protein [Elusimicrobiota bacterium]
MIRLNHKGLLKLLPKACLIGAAILLSGAAASSVPRHGVPEQGPAGREAPQPGAGGERTDPRLARNTGISEKVASSQAVLAYLRSPGQAALEAALKTCLAAREKVPDDVLNGFLLAFCRHELRDAAGESRALANYPPEKKDLYRFIFYEHRPELADALYMLPALLCKRLRETFPFPPGSKCLSFGGPISREQYRRGKRTIDRYVCPKCDEMLRLPEHKFFGNLLLRVKKDNPLYPVLLQVAIVQADRRRLKGDIPRLLALLGVRKGQVLADIGCGIGEVTFPLARAVGAAGKVYAEDIDENAIAAVRYCVETGGVKNVTPVLGSPTDTGIPPDTLDLALLFNVYQGIAQELEDKGPAYLDSFLDDFLGGIGKTLKKDGVLVIIDNLDPDFDVTAEKVTAALGKRGFRLVADKSDPRQRLILFFQGAGAGRSNGTRPGLRIN